MTHTFIVIYSLIVSDYIILNTYFAAGVINNLNASLSKRVDVSIMAPDCWLHTVENVPELGNFIFE